VQGNPSDRETFGEDHHSLATLPQLQLIRNNPPTQETAVVRSARRLFGPVGHYHCPVVFRLAVDTAPRPIVTSLKNGLPAE